MTSFLEKILNDDKVPLNYISELLCYCLLTRFMQLKKDRIDIDDIFKLLSHIDNQTVMFQDSDSKKKYQLKVSTSNINNIRHDCKHGHQHLMKLFNSCLLYVNEDLELKGVLSKWLKEEHGLLNINQHDSSIILKVYMEDRIPFNKNIHVSYDKKVNHGITIGKKDLNNDYGLYKQYQFLIDVFKFDVLNENIVDNYKKIANNGDNPSYMSMFEATKYLYECVSLELNKTISNDSEMINNISGGIKKIMVGEDNQSNEILRFDMDYQIDKVDYNKLKMYLSDMRIYTTVRGTKSPILAIMSKKENKELFRIRTRKEKYKNSTTGNRYKVYFESSNSFLDNILTRL